MRDPVKYVVVTLAFLVLPFTEDLIGLARFVGSEHQGDSPLAVVIMDVLVLVVLGALLWLEGRGLSSRESRFALWRLALALTLVLDVVNGWCLAGASTRVWSIVIAVFVPLAYLVPQVLLLVCIRRTIWRYDSPSQVIVATLPLLVGVYLAWLATALAYPALAVAIDKGQVVVNQEFFAQVSQLIPLLMIAVLLEPRLTKGIDMGGADVNVRPILVLILLAGAVSALLSLLRPDTSSLYGLAPWLEYLALLIATFAVGAALTSLALTVLVGAQSPSRQRRTTVQRNPGILNPTRSSVRRSRRVSQRSAVPQPRHSGRRG